MINKIKAVVLGHAIGDALGVPVEFATREELQKNPVTKMEGYGTYPYPKGCWSDDTSMSLCALDSLAKGKLDFDDVMVNFGKWYYDDQFTPTGKMFDVGNTCSYAITNYFSNQKSYKECGLVDEYSNGNGSLMRIYPFALFTKLKGMLLGPGLKVIHKASALTHAHPRSLMGCGIYAMVLWKLLETKNPTKETILKELESAFVLYDSGFSISKLPYNHYKELAYYEFTSYAQVKDKEFDDIKSGGYIVDTLEAALWCVLKTNSYKECVLTAVNLGNDTDTVAAIAGSLAGALYGYDGIPKEWIEDLKQKDYILELCETFYKNNHKK